MKHCSLFLALFASSALSAFGASVLINGGFEDPDVANGTGNPNLSEGSVPGWETTDSLGRIEIWDGPAGGFSAYEGEQFAEINAWENSALYQDVIIGEAGSVNYGFAHQGRLGLDTLRVDVIYAGADGVFQTAVGATVASGDDSFVVDGSLLTNQFTTGTGAWVNYIRTDSFTSVADGLYRFSYGAVSSAGGNPAAGNFIDGVFFGVNAIPEPSAALLGLAGGLLALRRRRA